MALVSAGLDHNIEIVLYISSIMTDHRAIYMVINTTLFERGSGYWKFNNLLLQDGEFVKIMNKELQTTIAASTQQDPKTKWETVKKRIKTTSVKYSRSKVNETQLVISALAEEVNTYEERFPLPQEEDEMYINTKTELEEKQLQRIAGVMFRSKARWYEQGERNTKYFFALEKARYNYKTCYKLINDLGQEITNPYQILEVQKQFYQELYSVDKDVEFNLNNTYNIYVPENIRKLQEVKLSEQDIQVAVKRMNNNKTPGQDGIPVDFYKVFWSQIKEVFMDMVEECYNTRKLHASARKGILNLIPKQNKDTRYIKNLRPITLLNTDYKIIEKAVADKMTPALEHIIHQDQRGFMKQRRISVNIRKMLDIIHQVEKEDLEAVVLSLDFVKCFDKCSFSILNGSLDFFKFGQVIKEWTKILYLDFTVRIQNNGHFSQEIDIEKGVHQGGCCSSVYFLIIAEILALALRNNSDIKGITLKEITNILNQFADDMDVFSEADERSIRAIASELQSFQKQSGFTVSYEKTTMYRIGSLRHSNAQLYNMDEFVWSSEDINVLGVTISHQDIMQKNYEPMIAKVKYTLQAWNNRGLSLIGKVHVVNTLIASLFVYKMMVLPMMPQRIIKCIENEIRDFIWNGKKSKIAYKILQNPKGAGGLELVNFRNKEVSLKATWPLILCKEDEYSKLVYSIMRLTGLGEDIWRCHLQAEDVDHLKIQNQFWHDILKSWAEYNYYTEVRTENQLIWYNSKIRIRGKPFYWQDAYKQGLRFVHQLFEDRQFKPDETIWQEFHLNTLRYNSLKAAIPKEWKEFFIHQHRGTYFPLPPHLYDFYALTIWNGLSRKVYKFMMDDCLLIHNKYVKWRTELGPSFEDSLYEYGKIHLDIYKTTNVPKLRSFQYRVLQRGIVTNIQLAKWGYKSSENCTYCNEHPESLVHLFYTCSVSTSLWQKVFEMIQQRFGTQQLTITPYSIICNKVAQGQGNIINFIVLYVKYFIYTQRCLEQSIDFPIFKAKLGTIENMEKYIAIKNNKLVQHNKKWEQGNTHDNLCRTPINEYVMQYMDKM